MKIDAQPTWTKDLSKQALNSLSVNNERVEKGSDQILMNPAWEKVPDEQIFASLEEILAQVSLTPKLREIEDENRSKFGPRSRAVGWSERKDSLFAYFTGRDDTVSVKLTDDDYFGHGSLRPASVASAVKSLISSSSSGLPFMQKKGVIKGAALTEYDQLVDEYPCVLFTRTQDDWKTRNIWGYPVGDTIRELTYFNPALELEKKVRWRAALWGPDAVDVAVSSLLTRMNTDDVAWSVDFEQFDASIMPEYIQRAFSAIAGLYQDREGVARICERFLTIPIFVPDGEVSGVHGVPSGSTFTNTVDSLVQFMIAGVSPDHCQIQGDDGLYITPEGMRDSAMENFRHAKLSINESKSFIGNGQEATYLQRYYHRDYAFHGDTVRLGSFHGAHPLFGGVYSVYRALGRIKYLERWTNLESNEITGLDFFTLRTIMILENCKHHPAFEAIVKYAQSVDKTGLSFTDAGVKAYSRMQESRIRAGVTNEANISGIYNFESVKILNA